MFRNSPLAVRGRYVFRPANTPHYPGLHNLGSRNWTTDERDPWPALGETPFAPRPYDKGELRAGNPPAILLGTADCIANGETLPLPVFVPPRTFPGGFDSRIYIAAGLPVPLDIVAFPVGGDLEAGTSVIGNPFFSGVTGGSSSDGYSIVFGAGIVNLAQGGTVEGLSGEALAVPMIPGGGWQSGGSASAQPGGGSQAAFGGDLEGGTATASHFP